MSSQDKSWSLEQRIQTSIDSSDIYQPTPPFPKNIMLSLTNACNHQCVFCANPNAAPCYMVFNRAHVSSEGYLNLCCVDYQNYLAVADLKEVSLADAWNSSEFVNMRQRHLGNKLEGTLCWSCINGKPSQMDPLKAELASPFKSNVELII